ncbi:hypothetical protein GCM10023190_23970 [Enteractinococcus fodinae]|uniref:Nucleotide-binding universal stress UspA family protein n=1 Tax=Enteractinococcus fodinae TaxID=684663 RepID=A0ABU2B4X4_9MICC|nr:universal stress protein [Enteractinococcus fodinae]MDR7347838.1 nucleotide-binding universal stress UspA family protein [Enteractinococcus fodinae]
MVFFPTAILVGVDHTRESTHAVLTAVELCQATNSPLHLAHVKLTSGLLRGRPMTPSQRGATDDEADAILQEFSTVATEAGLAPTDVHVRYGENTERELVRLQNELSAGLLVIGEGATGNLAARMFQSQHGSGAVDRSTGSVLVVRPPEGFVGRRDQTG